MRFVFILFSFIALKSFGCELDSLRSERRPEGLFVIHEVEEQETLFGIAKRYNSSIKSIIKFNQIENNRIEIGQVLSVLVEKEDQVVVEDSVIQEGFHRVEPGETLYSISRRYGMKVRELRSLNELSGNELSPGDVLRISADESRSVEVDTLVQAEPDKPVASNEENDDNTPEGFEVYLVQTGESLLSIARKRGTQVDSLKYWNELSSDYIRIGQKLFVRILPEVHGSDSTSTSTSTSIDDDGFEQVSETGIAAVISDITTSKFLALHRSLPIGTELQIRNLMNNLVVHVKVVGKLPNTGINKNVLIRLSSPAFEQLGILDAKSRVEVSHFK